MALEKYISKRNFNKTSEPVSGRSKNADALVFVIQKHAASHLHYDFRLEIRGVLKSWAVPKGPSTDPKIKRLAMLVEDHPFDYRTFEGIIPAGQYGGGTVIVWDEGTYEPADPEGKTKVQMEKQLLHDFYAGKLKIRLKGKKLKGLYAFVKAPGRGENSWLLMKLEDRYASQNDITEKDASVQSGQTLEEVAATSGTIYGQTKSNKKNTAVKAAKKSAASDKKKKVPAAKAHLDIYKNDPAIAGILKHAVKAVLPQKIQPMLATLVDAPFDDAEWQYEVKWDGYRALASIHKGEVALISRNNKSFNEKFYPVYQALQHLKLDVLIDGEIVVLDENGHADFQELQNWRSEADGSLTFYVFDILWLAGKNLMHLPLHERRTVLESLPVQDDGIIRLSPVFNESGTAFFKAAEEIGLEGIMAKKKDSEYVPDARSKSWLKIKTYKSQEIIICGYTLNEDSSKKFSALIGGIYKGGRLHYTGLVGTGFPEVLQQQIIKKLAPYVSPKCPFPEIPDYNKPSRFRPHPPKASVTWVRPKIVAEVHYREKTQEGVMRQASFKGLREDKKAAQVTDETPHPAKEIVNRNKVLHANKIIRAPEKSGRKTLLNPTDETQVRKVNGQELKFTNLSKLYWPEAGYTKRDMINYYYQVAPFMLPHLKGRPQSLNRFPDGIHGERFYQKNMRGKAPEWLSLFPYESEAEKKEMLIATDEASLLYMASLGCIEINPFFSKADSFDYPDYCVIDLDPDKNTFEQVIEAATVTGRILSALEVPAYCKTSGSTGMHIYIPLNGKYTYDQSQMFAKLIVSQVHKELASFTSLERMVKNRQGKMYLDYLQNRPGATIAGVYSLRPKPDATVSMPLHWEEVKPGLKMKDFTIANALARLQEEGDLFKGVLGKGINMQKAINKMETLFR